MLGILANNPYLSFSLDNLALFAHRFNRRSYFHDILLVNKNHPALKKAERHYNTAYSPMQAFFTETFLFISPYDPALGEIIG